MKKLVTLFLMLSFGKIDGQDFRFAEVGYTLFPQTELKEDANSKTSYQEFGIQFKLPIQTKNKKILLVNSLQYDLLQATLFEVPFFSELKTQKNFHKIAYALMAVHRLNENWTILARAKPTLVSDLNHDLNGKDFIFQGTLLASHKINSKLKLGAGIVYTTQTGEPLLLPAIQLSYNHNRHLLKMILPSHINYLYSLDEEGKYKLGLKAKFSGGNYAVNFNGNDKGISKSINRVVYSRGNAGLLYNMKLTEMLRLELQGGISMLRKYRFVDIENSTATFDAKNSGYFTTSLHFNIVNQKVENRPAKLVE